VTWKDFGWFVAAMLVFNVIGAFFGQPAKVLGIVGFAAVGYLVFRFLQRRWHRKLKTLAEAPDAERAAAIDAMDENDRVAARIMLGEVTRDEANAGPDGVVFRYPRTPMAIREGTFWMSVGIALFVLIALVRGKTGDEWPWAVAIALGFTVSVAYQLAGGWDRELRTVTLTSSGIQLSDHRGRRTGILWSEIAYVKTRLWLTCVDVHSWDGRRRARISADLEDFNRFMTLVAAYLEAPSGETPNSS
jgi:hypothetical protein